METNDVNNCRLFALVPQFDVMIKQLGTENTLQTECVKTSIKLNLNPLVDKFINQADWSWKSVASFKGYAC